MSEPIAILLLLKRVDCNDGVASYLESLVTGLRDHGDRVVVVSGEVTTLYESEARRRSISDAVLDWVVLDGLSASRPRPAHLRRILSLIRLHDVGVVSPQGFSMLPMGCVAGRLAGKPVVMNYHPSLQGDNTKTMTGRMPLRRRLAFRALVAALGADRYIALSRDIALFFEHQCGIPQRRIHEQVLGVETGFYRKPTDEERRHARRRLAIDEATLVAVLPGRMNLNKGHDVAAEAFRILATRRPDIDALCLFPGDGDQRGRIEADALRDRKDQALFRFLGFVEREVLRDTYWAADIVLLPSRLEGFGLVVAEAMCCGAIVIRTPSGGWQDQVEEGRTGFLVPFDDPPALAAAIETVSDSPRRLAIRDEVMRMASTKFSKERMITGTSALYREVAAAGKARRRG